MTLDPDLARRMREGCELIATAARAYSGWSERIPGTIRVMPAAGGVAGDMLIVAGGPAAPHAITFEAPNSPYYHHPLFARGPREKWDWIAQIPPRRFLKPAAENEFGAACRVIAQVVDDWAKFAGFK